MKQQFSLPGQSIYFLFCFLCLSFTSLAGNRNSIAIDNSRHMLVAACMGSNYQWFKDGVELSGAKDSLLIVAEAGNYKVVQKNAEGIVETTSITISINAAGAIIKVYTIGDSTVQDYNTGYYPRKGWGQVLQGFFNTANVQVINKAVGGTSSKSFYNNQWPAIKNALAAGDFVFIQFGINDAKHNPPDPARDAATGGEFEGFLQKFVEETRAKGAFPVLVTTVRRNAWNADGVTVYDAYHNYPPATRTVAKSLNVPLVDLDAKLKVAMEAAGKTYTTRFWHNNYVAGEYANYPNGNTDDVHFQEMGAINNASLVVQSIKELSADANVSKLIPFIKPQFEMKINVNPKGSDDATTLTTLYPQGLTVTLKTLPKSGKTFQKWNDGSGTSIATKTLTTVTSPAAPSLYTAVYSGATTCTATASASGPTKICAGQSVTLTASAGTSYSWKNGSAVLGTAGTFKASAAGSYTVDITNAAGCTASASAIVVTVDTPANCGVTGIEDFTSQEDIHLCFPNPFTNSFSLSTSGKFAYSILSTEGIVLENGHGENLVVAGKSLEPGIYLVRLETSEAIRFVKVWKQQ